MNHPILTARVVRCKFDDDNRNSYAYFTDDPTIEVGDFVVVVSPNGPGVRSDAGYPKVVRVTSTTETVESITKVREWIVCKLDLSGYAERREREEKRQVLIAKIDRAAEEARGRFDLQQLATASPELKALLDQLAAI